MVIAYQRKSNLIAMRNLAVVCMQIRGSGLRQFFFCLFCHTQGHGDILMFSARCRSSPGCGVTMDLLRTQARGPAGSQPGQESLRRPLAHRWVGWKARRKSKGGVWARGA